MDEVKSPLKSLTVVAATASALASMLGAAGIVDAATADSAGNAVSQLVSAGLALIAVYGRIRATSRIGRES